MPSLTLTLTQEDVDLLSNHWGYDGNGSSNAYAKNFLIDHLKRQWRIAKRQAHEDAYITPNDPAIT